MAIRSDVTTDFTFSPRLTTVAEPSTAINLQDLNDSLRDIEADPYSMDDRKLIDAAGKTDIGGGKATGITGTLRDNQVSFGTRVSRRQTGTISSSSSNGDTLIDGTGDLSGNGAVRGDLIHNITDNSWSTLLQVDSTAQARCLALDGGADNTFTVGDSYEIYETVECAITDGDLVATNSTGGSLNPILPTFGVFVTRELSTSPSIVDGDISDQFVELSSTGGNITVQYAMQAILAASAGLLSGATSTDLRIRNQADDKDRIAAGVTGTGDRVSITLNFG